MSEATVEVPAVPTTEVAAAAAPAVAMDAGAAAAAAVDAPLKKETKLSAASKEFVPRASAPAFVPKGQPVMPPIPQTMPMQGEPGVRGAPGKGYDQYYPQPVYPNAPQMGYPGPMGMHTMPQMPYPPAPYYPHMYPPYAPPPHAPFHAGGPGGGRGGGKYENRGPDRERDPRRMNQGPDGSDEVPPGPTHASAVSAPAQAPAAPAPVPAAPTQAQAQAQIPAPAPAQAPASVPAHPETRNGRATEGGHAPVTLGGYAAAAALPPQQPPAVQAHAPTPAQAPAAASSAPAAAPAHAPAPASVPAPSPAPVHVPTFAEKVAAAAARPPPAPPVPVHDAENKPRGFGSRATTATTDAEGGEWSRESRPARDQAAFSRNGGGGGGGAGTGHGTGGAGGGGGGWKRGEAIQSDSLALRDDGVKRYDKATLLGLYKTKKVCPDTIKEQYLHLAQIERQPLLLKTIKQLPPPKSKSSGHVNEEPHPDEQIIFAQNKEGKEGVFRYQPSRLSDTTDPAVILSKANLILNKLSMTKFDKLSDEFMAVGLDSEDLMDKAVEMIVQKAQLEEHFCFMYADLCRKITDQWSSGSAENEESLGKSFRVKLLEYCRAEFSRNRVAELEAIRNMEISPEEKDEREIVLKKRYTGTMRFIGEVYMKNLVNSGIMQTCITELLQATEEETLVCMCKLFRTIGHKLQQNDSKKKTDKVSEFFETISKMAVEHPSSRMRFMLKDLVDLRKAGWVERRETEKAVKLSELRGEEAPSGGKGHTASSRASSSSNISSFGSKSQDARASRVEPAADEWSVVPEKSKAKVRAPGSSGGFGQSSSTSSSAKSSNAFSALGKSSGSVKPKDAVKASGSSKAAPSVTKKSNAVERVAAVGGLRTESPALSDAPDEEGVGMEHSVSFGVSENGESPRSVTGQAGAGGGTVDKAVVEQVKRFVTGYFSELEKDDVTESIQSVVHPDGMGDIIRPCILLAFDKREADRENLVNLFVHLHSEGVLRTEQVARGLSAFLDDLDETAIDVPMAATYGANMLAVLVVQDVINLSFLTQLPDEHNFPTSPKAAAFIGQTISFISKLTSPESAAAMYKASGVDLKQLAVPGPKESAEQAYEELLSRYAIQFI